MKKTTRKAAYQFGTKQNKATNLNFNHSLANCEGIVWFSTNDKYLDGDRAVKCVGSISDLKKMTHENTINGGTLRINEPTGKSYWLVDTSVKLEDTYYYKNADPNVIEGIQMILSGAYHTIGLEEITISRFMKCVKIPDKHVGKNLMEKTAVQLLAHFIADHSDPENIPNGQADSYEDLDAATQGQNKRFWMIFMSEVLNKIHPIDDPKYDPTAVTIE